MKIVCGSCGAKYSIADEKVQGKVFKIRCRKCSNVIVVKGNAEEEAQAADSVGVAGSSQSGTQEWYVVIDGEQAGPLSADDVESYFIQGRINGESYIWRDGMADWTTLFGVDAFMHLNNNAYGEDDATMVASSPLQSQSPIAGAFAGSGQDDFDESEDATAVVSTEAFHQFEQQQQQDPFQDQTSQESFGAEMGFGSEPSADPFAAQDGGYNSNLDAGMGAGMGAGMDAGFDSGYAAAGFQEQPASSLDFNSNAGNDPGLGFGAASAGGAGLASFDSSASTGGDDGMFAAFDSNSNFDNNGSLAYQSFAGLNGSNNSELDFGSATAAPSQTADNGNAMIGQRNENSVLFSLSSLNSVEAVKGPDSNDAANTEGSGLIDIQALASSHQQLNASRSDAAPMPSPETFSPGTMSVPAIMPARGSHRSNKGLIIGVAVGVIALLGVGIAAIVMLSNRDNNKQPQQVVIKEKVIVKEKIIDNTKNDDKAKKEADEAAKKALAAKTPPATDEKTDDEKSTKSTKSTRRTKRNGKSTKTTKSTDSGAKATASSSKTKKGGVDSLLDSLDKKKTKTTASTKTEDPKPAANVPKKLSKPQVQSTFRKYNGRIRTCSRSKNSGKLSGTLWVRVTIEPSGKISSASVDSKSSKFKGTDVGRCVVGVVKSMRFPQSQSKLSFSYPLII